MSSQPVMKFLPAVLACVFMGGSLAATPRERLTMIVQTTAAHAVGSTVQSPPSAATGVDKPGNGVELPRVTKMVRPQYTAKALAHQIQGVVWVDAVVLPNGKVGDVSVTKSLDPVYGLDQQAVKAVKKWRFIPGNRFGTPVAVLVTIELTFTLAAQRQSAH